MHILDRKVQLEPTPGPYVAKLYTFGKMLTHSLLQCHHYYVIMHVIARVEIYSFDSVCCD
jgi:hypothetical protein